VIDEFHRHRPLLFGIAYRMLGRVVEAEDMVQEAWLRWRARDPAQVETPRAWLVAAVTRLCIDQLRSARHQRVDYYGVWLPEPLVESGGERPDEAAKRADSLTIAFILLLENLSPDERAVFLLREVFDYDYAEIAKIIGKTEANCRKLASRAKAGLARHAEGRDRDAERAPSARARSVVDTFLAATQTGDVADLVALLTSDATLLTDGGGLVASAGRPIVTADRISRFFVGVRRRTRARVDFHPAVINRHPGALVYVGGKLDRTISFELAADRIRAIYIVRNPEKLRHLQDARISA
jgi:RNA polymerase sigma-70 factor (ECF subfamily)